MDECKPLNAGGHTLGDTVRAAINRRDALRGALEARVGGKTYTLVSVRLQVSSVQHSCTQYET